jgi:oligopeptide/dipeptide ABC transporter ATP-binding protein
MNNGPINPVRSAQRKPLLHVADLTVDFDTSDGWARCLHGVDLEVHAGEILGLVGESGCGKSVTCLAVMQLLGPRASIGGHVHYKKQNLLALDEKVLNGVRGRDIAMIFQDPMSTLNPVHTIGRQVMEAVVYNTAPSALKQEPATVAQGGKMADQVRITARAARDEAQRLLTHVGIPEPKQRLKEYPHQLSGGMNQRAMIAMALAGRPQLLIADEPTTALDVTIQAQILELLCRLRDELGMSIILITHDLSVVAETCDRVAVMYCGRIVEKGSIQPMFANPLHPYTRGLLASIPRIDRSIAKLYPVPGSVPAPHELPQGCAFAPRCPVVLNECQANPPALVQAEGDQSVACFNPQDRRS